MKVKVSPSGAKAEFNPATIAWDIGEGVTRTAPLSLLEVVALKQSIDDTLLAMIKDAEEG